MKKTLNTLLITVGFSSLAFGAAGIYTPAPGPLNLGDAYMPSPGFAMGPMIIQRGVIMNALLTSPELTNESAMIYMYTKTPLNGTLPLYQQIIESLKTSVNNNTSIAAIEAFEAAIMKILHYEHYIYYTEGRWSNMFFTGIRKTWFSPSDWVNISTWLPSYTSPDIAQLMMEIRQLSQIAKRHSLALSMRLSNKADSYLYWKARTLKTIAALGTAAGAYYYRNDINNALNYAYDLKTDFINSAYNTGANLRDAAYNTGASIGNYASSWRDFAYNKSAALGQYVGSYLPASKQ